jgi:enoyl-CoA hydratase/carnithine racemase
VAFARDLAANVPVTSLAVIKQQVWHHPQLPRDDALRESNKLMNISTRGSPEYKEGVASFLEKRAPEFEDYDPTRPLIVAAQEVFGPRGANLLGKL